MTTKNISARSLEPSNSSMSTTALSPSVSAIKNYRPSIIDVEASGFGPHSYPIEVGIVLKNGLRISRLIRPMPDWTHWDPCAEKIHGISQAKLQRYGHHPHVVARELNELLAGETVFSDAWVVDKPWLDTLYNRLAIERKFFISPIESIVSEQQLEQWLPAKQELIPQMGNRVHRALDDAVLIQEIFVHTRLQRSVANV